MGYLWSIALIAAITINLEGQLQSFSSGTSTEMLKSTECASDSIDVTTELFSDRAEFELYNNSGADLTVNYVIIQDDILMLNSGQIDVNSNARETVSYTIDQSSYTTIKLDVVSVTEL